MKSIDNDELIKSYGDKWVNRIQDIEHILSDKEAYKEFKNKLGIERRIEMANSVLEDNKRAVEAAVYDLQGRRVFDLLQLTSLEAGRYLLNWNGNANDGSQVPGGIYIYMIIVNGISYGGKMILIR